ncbi:DUF6517 family protein, partial [Halodesulfurarchaeum sp.]|uniref:DUF6517 family protein n=1 Tax=Halodesulfurarchaeum sp. TaxID=1980530 RepID=UPI002FC3451F
ATGRSIPGWPSGGTDGGKVLVIAGDQSNEVDGGSEETLLGTDMGLQPANAGEEIPMADTRFAIVDAKNPSLGEDRLQMEGSETVSSETLFDAGAPAPLAGATFSLGTLSTPDVSVAGQSANPLGSMDTTELLQHDTARKIIVRAGLTDGVTAEWIDGPREVSGEYEPQTVTVLDTDSTLRSFVGVVSGTDGPWAVGVHVARVMAEDRVVVAGVHRHPIGSRETGFETGDGWRQTISRARDYMDTACGRLQTL